MPFPASGGFAYMRFTPKIIRFQRHGCTNRPFFHIVVMEVSTFLTAIATTKWIVFYADGKNYSAHVTSRMLCN